MKRPRYIFLAVVTTMAVLAGAGVRIVTRHSPSPSVRGPHLQLPNKPVELGIMQPDEQVTRAFEVRNSGTEPLKIAKVSANCGCTEPVIDRYLLRAGETAKVTVTFDSAGFSRNVHKQVIFESNDPAKPLAVVLLSGYVQIGLRADATVLNLGRVRVGESAAGEMHLFRDTGRVTKPVTLAGQTQAVTADVGAWLPQLEAEQAKIRIQISSVTDDVGLHHRDVKLEAGDSVFPVRLDYEVVPVVEYSPAEVAISAVSPRERNVRLSWAGHRVVFEGAEAHGGKCQATFGKVGETECSLLIQPKSEDIPRDGDFDMIRVSYRLADTGRREVTTIPVIFLDDRSASR